MLSVRRGPLPKTQLRECRPDTRRQPSWPLTFPVGGLLFSALMPPLLSEHCDVQLTKAGRRQRAQSYWTALKELIGEKMKGQNIIAGNVDCSEKHWPPVASFDGQCQE